MPRAKRRSARSEDSLARAGSRAREARERGLREGNAGRPAVGARYIRAGLRHLGCVEEGKQPGARQVHEAHQALAAMLLGTLAEWETELGHAEYGLRLLDHAERLTAADNRGILLLQRGMIFMRTGREGDAVTMLDDAVAQLEGNSAETASLATALLNRSFAHLNLGQVRRARADLVCCRRVATDEGHDLIAAKALHNLGYCDLLAGDIPAALQLFNVAADAYRLAAPGFLLVLATDKAAALLAAGLAGDAASELDDAMASSRRLRLDQNWPKRSWPGRRLRWPLVSWPRLADGRLPPSGVSGGEATTPGPAWRSSPGCGACPSQQRVRRQSPLKRCSSPSGCAAAGWPTTRTWPSCSRLALCSRPGIRMRPGDDSSWCGTAGRRCRWTSA